jgi:hypothetical protein
MKSIEIKIDDVLHKLLYVEYDGRVPFYVVTAHFVPEAICGAYWRLCGWDFFFDQDDKGMPMYYESSSGGSIEDGIEAPKFIRNKRKIWKSEEIQFRGTPENCIVLDKPYQKNPFRNRYESSGYTVCEVCGMSFDIDSRSEEFPCGHAYWDEEYEVKYY